MAHYRLRRAADATPLRSSILNPEPFQPSRAVFPLLPSCCYLPEPKLIAEKWLAVASKRVRFAIKMGSLFFGPFVFKGLTASMAKIVDLLFRAFPRTFAFHSPVAEPARGPGSRAFYPGL